MGISIYAKKDPQKVIDLGMGGFFNLRKTVSNLAGEPWASHYKKLTDTLLSRQADKFWEEFDNETERLIAKKAVSIKLVDFCLQPDTRGAIHYGACKQLLKIIGDYDDDILYGYWGPDYSPYLKAGGLCTRWPYAASYEACAGATVP